MAGRVLVGTSSWADPGFVEEWYPPGMPARARLPWYAQRFEAVELNSSFYALPDPRTVERWSEVTPPGFVFDVKLHKLLSRHAADVESLPPDLRGRVEVVGRGRVQLTPQLEKAMARRTVDTLEPLRSTGRLGVLLLQLSPAFSPRRNQLDELDGLLEALSPLPVAIELRNRGWVDGERVEETLDWMSERGAAFVGVDAPVGEVKTIMPPVDAVTRPDLAYFRAHGRNLEGYVSGRTVAERFAWVYEPEELQEIAGRVQALAEEADVVHVMFNNNRGSDAPKAARDFRELLGQDPGPPPDREGPHAAAPDVEAGARESAGQMRLV